MASVLVPFLLVVILIVLIILPFPCSCLLLTQYLQARLLSGILPQLFTMSVKAKGGQCDHGVIVPTFRSLMIFLGISELLITLQQKSTSKVLTEHFSKGKVAESSSVSFLCWDSILFVQTSSTLYSAVNCKQLPWITKKKQQQKKPPFSLEFRVLPFGERGGLMKRLTSSTTPQMVQALSRAGGPLAMGEEMPAVPCPAWGWLWGSCVSPQRACPPARPSRWTRRTSAGKGRARRAAGACGECTAGSWAPTQQLRTSQPFKGSFFPHCLFSQKCLEVARLCAAHAGVWYSTNCKRI